MHEKVRWGVLGTANIAVKKVIPAMQPSAFCEIAAIASRNIDKSRTAAIALDIPRAYGSYESLLGDPSIDAVYIPLPNNLHLEWTTKAAEAGKHVLCEKPIGLNADDVRRMIDVRDRTNVKIQEAFMVRTHPEWLRVQELIRMGKIGELKAITGFFSYFNDDKVNIRNKLATGGGGLLDIGCYCINTSRLIFESEPTMVSGVIKRDPSSGVDILASAILEFPSGHASFTCSTQLVPYQRMQFFGTKGRIEVQIPFNIPVETSTKIFIDDGSDLYGENIVEMEFESANQYTIQGDLFSKAILENSEQEISLEDSFGNMAVIDSIFRSAKTGKNEVPEAIS